MWKRLLLVACVGVGAQGVFGQTAEVFRDPQRSTPDRVKDLLSRLTLEEKASLMSYESAAVPRLGIPAYNWWNECLHGVARAGRATVFPQAIGLAATFDDGLVRMVGEAIGEEARAKYNAALKDGASGQYQGLTFWTPNINIDRDPRWGRGQETYGEDPFLTGRLAAALVDGLQGDDARYLRAAACAKHFAVHSGPESSRHKFNAVVSDQDLNETYLPAFKMLVEHGVAGVMCAYNRTDDEPCCGSNRLLKSVLREKWGFGGYIVSDCGALSDMNEGHHFTKDETESAGLAVKNTVGISCGGTYAHLAEAVKRGLATEADVDAALGPALAIRFRLGMFDAAEMVPYSKIGAEVIDSEKHRAIARRAAVESIVLLQNKGSVLPLKGDVRSIAVVGPNAAGIEPLLGNYSGLSGRFTTFLEGITARAGAACTVQYAAGCVLAGKADAPMDSAPWVSRGSDVTIAVLGLTSQLEGEEGDAMLSTSGGDRKDLGLPASQMALLHALRKDNKHPLIAVLTGGGAQTIKEVGEIADAVLFAWYPGEEGGSALADILFGDVSPSGRLPVTFPESLDQLPAFDDYAMQGRTYRYMTKEPLYPFGFGLSYTTFSYSDLKVSRESVKAGEAVQARFVLENTGPVAGEEVVQLYITREGGGVNTPRASLKQLVRVSLGVHEKRAIVIDITGRMRELCNEHGVFAEAPGEYTITVGGCSPGARGGQLGAPVPVSARVRVGS